MPTRRSHCYESCRCVGGSDKLHAAVGRKREERRIGAASGAAAARFGAAMARFGAAAGTFTSTFSLALDLFCSVST
jgi:hypothetical protein